MRKATPSAIPIRPPTSAPLKPPKSLASASTWKPGSGAGVAPKRKSSWAMGRNGSGTLPSDTSLARRRSSISITRANISGIWRANCIPTTQVNQKAWMKVHQKRLLDKGKIEKLVLALRSIVSTNPEVTEKIRIEADYFERNAERMRYPKFRRQHLFVGSGVIEAGCKTVIGSRLQTVRHVLDGSRSQRHHRPAMLPSQRPL